MAAGRQAAHGLCRTALCFIPPGKLQAINIIPSTIKPPIPIRTLFISVRGQISACTFTCRTCMFGDGTPRAVLETASRPRRACTEAVMCHSQVTLPGLPDTRLATSGWSEASYWLLALAFPRTLA